MRRAVVVIAGTTLAVIGLLLIDAVVPGAYRAGGQPAVVRNERPRAKTTEELVREALRRSENVKGVYMTSAVANDPGRPATKLRNDIIALVDGTELNGVVIDVKEADGGPVITPSLTELIRDLHSRGAWVIARLVVFKDSSQEQMRPEWYLKRSNGAVWRDRRGGSWLDPASRDVWAYQAAAARAASDAGFDEIQFDYIRFPSDGNVAAIVYPVYDGKRGKHEILREFFAYLKGELKRYRPELILSADLFGYVAIQQADLSIGQRLADIGDSFEYVSFMVYPSHYYTGFEAPADPVRSLAAVSYPYQATAIERVASNQPYDVVHRSLLIAADFLAGKIATSSAAAITIATSTPGTSPAPQRRSNARLRPWLQHFDLAVDTSRGIRYDAAKVRAQIDAAEAAGASGWLLWNPDNVYMKEALKPAG